MASKLQERILRVVNQSSSAQEKVKIESPVLKQLLYGLLVETSENLSGRSIYLPPGDPSIPYFRQELRGGGFLINHCYSVGEPIGFDEYVEEIVDWQPGSLPQVIAILFQKAQEYGYKLTLKHVPKKVREQLRV